MTPALDRIRGAMAGLKMSRALEELDHTMQKLEQGEITAIEAIDSLLSEEYNTRETRRIDVALRTSAHSGDNIGCRLTQYTTEAQN